MQAKIFVLKGCLFIVTDLADRHDAFLGGESRQNFHNRLGKSFIVRLLRVEADAAIVAHAELSCPEAFETQNV